jgi:hypothetical protein
MTFKFVPKGIVVQNEYHKKKDSLRLQNSSLVPEEARASEESCVVKLVEKSDQAIN